MENTQPKESNKSNVTAVKKTEKANVPAHPVSPFEALDQLFESYLPRGWMRPFRAEWPMWSELQSKWPRVDVIDRDDEILVRAQVPGIDKEDLDISVTDSTVSLKGQTRHEEKEEKGDYYRCEISQDAFTRSVALPGEVDSENAKAKIKDGVLELTLPKAERSKRRSIRID